MKQKITLIYECEQQNISCSFFHSSTPRKVTVEIPGDITLPELLEQFDYFIKSIGFFAPVNTHLDYIDNSTE